MKNQHSHLVSKRERNSYQDQHKSPGLRGLQQASKGQGQHQQATKQSRPCHRAHNQLPQVQQIPMRRSKSFLVIWCFGSVWWLGDGFPTRRGVQIPKEMSDIWGWFPFSLYKKGFKSLTKGWLTFGLFPVEGFPFSLHRKGGSNP